MTWAGKITTTPVARREPPPAPPPPIAQHAQPAPAMEFDLRRAQLRAFPRPVVALNDLLWSLRCRLANKARSKPRPVRHADQRRK